MFLLDGFGASPQNVLLQSELPVYTAKQGILTVLPILKTGPLYFGVDNASQQSLKIQIETVIDKYHLEGKEFYIGGFSIGGRCVDRFRNWQLEIIIRRNLKQYSLSTHRSIGNVFIIQLNGLFDLLILRK